MRTPKGIRVTDKKVGSGAIAEKGKYALIHYASYLPRGELYESSRHGGACAVTRGGVCSATMTSEPVLIKVGDRMLRPAIAYGVPGMLVGGVRSVRVSPNITHDERFRNSALPPNAVLRYEIELLEVMDESHRMDLWMGNR